MIRFQRPLSTREGVPKEMMISVKQDISDMAFDLVNVGCRFQIEELESGDVYMTVEYEALDEPLVNQICKHGADLEKSVAYLVQNAHIKLFPERYHT